MAVRKVYSTVTEAVDLAGKYKYLSQQRRESFPTTKQEKIDAGALLLHYKGVVHLTMMSVVGMYRLI